MKEILDYCKRSKNFVIHPSINKILNKAFINSNATKLPEGSFGLLYAEKKNLFEEMSSPTNQVIW